MCPSVCGSPCEDRQRKLPKLSVDSATNELPLSAINYRGGSSSSGAGGQSNRHRQTNSHGALISPDTPPVSALHWTRNEQIFETILMLPQIVKHSRISLMATNERPLSCATCLFGTTPLSTSNSLNNLSGGRRNSLLTPINEDSPLLNSFMATAPLIAIEDDEVETRRSLPRSTSAPELFSESLISDSVVNLDEVSVTASTGSGSPPPNTLKALRFRGNKSMSEDATASVVDDPAHSLLSHLKSSSFLVHILEPTLSVTYSLDTPHVDKGHEHLSPFPECPKPQEIREDEEDSSEPLGDLLVPSLSITRRQPAPPNVVVLSSSNLPQNTSSTTAPHTPSTTTTARRPRHSFAGQMSYSKLWGFGTAGGVGGKKMPTAASTNSLFSTAVISGSSSAPNLRDMIQNASTTGECFGMSTEKFNKIEKATTIGLLNDWNQKAT